MNYVFCFLVGATVLLVVFLECSLIGKLVCPKNPHSWSTDKMPSFLVGLYVQFLVTLVVLACYFAGCLVREKL